MPRIGVNPPGLTWVSSVTGQVIPPTDTVDNAHWRRLAGESSAFPDGLRTFAGTGADLLVELGSYSGEGSIIAPHWAGRGDAQPQPVVVDSRLRPGDGTEDASAGFLRAVAAAYEAGLPISFPGLFAGERRRRIAIPGYPFQRRSFWVQNRNTSD